MIIWEKRQRWRLARPGGAAGPAAPLLNGMKQHRIISPHTWMAGGLGALSQSVLSGDGQPPPLGGQAPGGGPGAGELVCLSPLSLLWARLSPGRAMCPGGEQTVLPSNFNPVRSTPGAALWARLCRQEESAQCPAVRGQLAFQVLLKWTRVSASRSGILAAPDTPERLPHCCALQCSVYNVSETDGFKNLRKTLETKKTSDGIQFSSSFGGISKHRSEPTQVGPQLPAGASSLCSPGVHAGLGGLDSHRL